MGQLNCSLEIPKENFSLTVGQVFYLKCQGEIPAIEKNKLELRLDEADKYKLVLLQSGFPSSSEAVFKVTTYKPGRHQIKAPQIIVGNSSVVLSDIDLEVTSMINPQEKPEGPIAIGALTLSIPLIYWIILSSVLTAIAVFFALKWYRRRVRKKLIDELSVHDSAQTPFQQFHARLRKMQRNYTFLSNNKEISEESKKFVVEMNEAYRIFLARSFKVPALKWKDSLILADLKKYQRKVYDEFGVEIKSILKEFSYSLRATAQVSMKDCHQFLDITRKNVDRLEIYKKKQQQQEGVS